METRKKKEFVHPVLSMYSFFSLATCSGFSHVLSVGLIIYQTVPLHDNQLQQIISQLFRPLLGTETGGFLEQQCEQKCVFLGR